MKFTVKQSDISQVVSLVSRAVPSKPSHPILENVLLEVDSNSLRVTGFDMVLGIQSSVDVANAESGSIAVPAKLLADIVTKLPDGDITFDLISDDDSHLLRIKHKRNKYDIRIADASEYPRLPESSNQPIEIEKSALLVGLKGSIFSASTDESKGVLMGVNLAFGKDFIRFGATDGHRLASVEVEHDTADTINPLTIPAKSLTELEKILTKSNAQDEFVKLFVDDFQIIFAWGRTTITMRALEAQFPDYMQLLPKQFSISASCDRKELISAIDRLSVLNDSRGLVVARFESGASHITLHSVSQDTGTGEECIDCNCNADIELCFNAGYLMDGLKSISSQEIQLNINQSLMPVVINPVGGIKSRYLVMPVQMK